MTLTLTKALEIDLKLIPMQPGNPAYKGGAAGYNGARIRNQILPAIQEERKRGRPWQR